MEHVRVLVVDDEPDIRETLEQIIEGELGAEVDTAPSGEDAQRLAEAAPYDVVITDQRMGRMPGSELLAWLAARQPGTRRVLMSAFHESFAAPAVARAQAHLYVHKPFRVPELLEALGTWASDEDPAPSDA